MCDSNPTIFSETLNSLSGPVKYTLLNDVVFHIAMNRSQNVALKGLISSLLGVPDSDIRNVHILNPYDYKTASAKYVILDVKVEFNDSEHLNIELQTYHDDYWSNRSLVYLGRTFDDLESGTDYSKIFPATHVSIMTYDMFPDHPEFYAHYLMKNVKNDNVYATNFRLNVLCLKHTGLATKEDRENGLVSWARLFLATTWEAVRELALESPALKEVAESMARSNTDRQEEYLAQAQIDFIRSFGSVYQSGINEGERKSAAIIAKQADKISAQAATISEKDTIISGMDAALSEKDAEIASLKAELASLKGFNN